MAHDRTHNMAHGVEACHPRGHSHWHPRSSLPTLASLSRSLSASRPQTQTERQREAVEQTCVTLNALRHPPRSLSIQLRAATHTTCPRASAPKTSPAVLVFTHTHTHTHTHTVGQLGASVTRCRYRAVLTRRAHAPARAVLAALCPAAPCGRCAALTPDLRGRR